MVARGRGKEELFSNGYSFSFVRQRSPGDQGHSNVSLLSTIELYT